MITPGKDFKRLSIPTILNMNPVAGIALAEKYEHGNKKTFVEGGCGKY